MVVFVVVGRCVVYVICVCDDVTVALLLVLSFVMSVVSFVVGVLLVCVLI